MKKYLKVSGKGGISVTVVADSIHYYNDPEGERVATLLAEYPRFIHGEVMTHRALSKNSSSSRAIPVAKVLEQVRINPAMPIHWGVNRAGMQAYEELTGNDLRCAQRAWKEAARAATDAAEHLGSVGVHKQVANRLLEPFQRMRVVITATSFDNLLHLRLHKATRPEFQELAKCLYLALKQSSPTELREGMWHTPFYEDGYWSETHSVPLETALRISASCCAQTSYRKLDTTEEKADAIWNKLVSETPVHSSPTEHQATPIFDDIDWPKGVTHVDRQGNFWSNNFKGWVQHRALIPNNVCEVYEDTWDVDLSHLKTELIEGF